MDRWDDTLSDPPLDEQNRRRNRGMAPENSEQACTCGHRSSTHAGHRWACDVCSCRAFTIHGQPSQPASEPDDDGPPRTEPWPEAALEAIREATANAARRAGAAPAGEWYVDAADDWQVGEPRWVLKQQGAGMSADFDMLPDAQWFAVELNALQSALAAEREARADAERERDEIRYELNTHLNGPALALITRLRKRAEAAERELATVRAKAALAPALRASITWLMQGREWGMLPRELREDIALYDALDSKKGT